MKLNVILGIVFGTIWLVMSLFVIRDIMKDEREAKERKEHGD